MDRSRLWHAARNILCVRLDNMGDVLMTTPAIHALKSMRSAPRITLLASRGGAEAARYVPDIDAVIAYDAPWVRNDTAPDAQRDLAMRRTLEGARFDAAVIFTVYSQSPLPAAMLCHLAGIPLRLAHCRENPYALLTDWLREHEPADFVRHEAQRQLELVAAIGAPVDSVHMRLEIPPHAHAKITALLTDAGIPSAARLIVMHPGASAPSRRYPAERFAQVARTLIDSEDCHVLVTGGSDEHALVDSVCTPAQGTGRIHNIAGQLKLGELAALIARADLLISNNTGPVHIASAVGTPVVDLYALTNPQHTPWKVPHRVLFRDVSCKYCYKSVCPQGHNYCLHGVEPGEVVVAAAELLNGLPRADVANMLDSARARPLRRAPGPDQSSGSP